MFINLIFIKTIVFEFGDSCISLSLFFLGVGKREAVSVDDFVVESRREDKEEGFGKARVVAKSDVEVGVDENVEAARSVHVNGVEVTIETILEELNDAAEAGEDFIDATNCSSSGGCTHSCNEILINNHWLFLGGGCTSNWVGFLEHIRIFKAILHGKPTNMIIHSLFLVLGVSLLAFVDVVQLAINNTSRNELVVVEARRTNHQPSSGGGRSSVFDVEQPTLSGADDLTDGVDEVEVDGLKEFRTVDVEATKKSSDSIIALARNDTSGEDDERVEDLAEFTSRLLILAVLQSDTFIDDLIEISGGV